MPPARFYPIGTPGVAWGMAEKQQWLEQQTVKRSYAQLVLSRLDSIRKHFEVTQYGALTLDPERYPLYAIRTKAWDEKKPNVLITGGVHGYETSGIMGALLFVDTKAAEFEKNFNFVVCPCVCPWGFETINRMNPMTYDPNRHFFPDSPAEECSQLMSFLSSLKLSFFAHFDLHETTDTDATEFMPAKAAHAGKESYTPLEVPDGFYVMASMEDPQLEWHKAMIDEVAKVTHIAGPDKNGNIVDLPMLSPGIVHELGEPDHICSGYMKGTVYATTSEVYPDSKTRPVSDEVCNKAQVACLVGGLTYLANLKDKQ